MKNNQTDYDLNQIYNILKKQGYSKSIDEMKQDLEMLKKNGISEVLERDLSLIAGGLGKERSKKFTASILSILGIAGGLMPNNHAAAAEVSPAVRDNIKNFFENNPKAKIIIPGVGVVATLVTGGGIFLTALGGRWIYNSLTKDKLIFDKLSNEQKDIIKGFVQKKDARVVFEEMHKSIEELFEKVKNADKNYTWEQFKKDVHDTVNKSEYLKKMKLGPIKTQYKSTKEKELIYDECITLLSLADKSYALAKAIKKIDVASVNIIAEPLKLIKDIYDFMEKHGIRLEEKRSEHFKNVKAKLSKFIFKKEENPKNKNANDSANSFLNSQSHVVPEIGRAHV